VLSENAVFASVKRLTDESTVLESQQFDVSKIRSDSFSLGEILAYGANLAKTDTLGVTEVLTVTRNPFAFEFAFGDGFTNVSGSPDDQFSFTDGQTFGVSITLQDYFALDDFNQIDKHAGANKTNVYSLQDEHAVTFGKILDDSLNFSDPVAISFSKPFSDSYSFADDANFEIDKITSDSYGVLDGDEKSVGKTLQDSTNPLTDNAIFAFTKSSSDNIIISEVQTFTVSKPATDSVAVSDTPVLSPRIGKLDSLTMSDSLIVHKLVASAQPNKGIVGFMLLNAD
jgi:hypothetical protein